MMKYGEMTRRLRHLFKDDSDGEERGDTEWAGLRRLLGQEAEGKPIPVKDIHGGEIFIRLKPPVTLFLVLQRPAVENLRTLEEIRSTLSCPPPVVVIAPPASSEFKMQMLERGIYTYLEQPIQAGQIERLVEEIRTNSEWRSAECGHPPLIPP